MTEDIIKQAVAQSSGWAGVIRALDWKIGAAAYTRVKRLVEEHGLDTSHFTGQSWSKGLSKDDPRVAGRGRGK